MVHVEINDLGIHCDDRIMEVQLRGVGLYISSKLTMGIHLAMAISQLLNNMLTIQKHPHVAEINVFYLGVLCLN